MDFMTVKEASEMWKTDISTIGKMLRLGKIDGATKLGGHWVIPKGTPKPADGRRKKVKCESDFYRFPLYVNSDENDFIPPLSIDEKALRQAEKDFYSCNLEKAKAAFENIAKSSKKIHIRQMALFFLCLLSAIGNNGQDYKKYYKDFEFAFSKDFPYKKETELLRPWLFSALTMYKNAAYAFNIDVDYEYSPSVYPLMAYLSFIDKESMENPALTDVRINVFETESMQLEYNGCFLEAQLIHLTLFVAYYTKGNENSALRHLKKAVEIGFENSFLYNIADAYPYYKKPFDKVLADYPQEFSGKIKQCGINIDKFFSVFAENNNISEIFSLLSDNDIKFVLYAVRGYSYKQVAGIAHISSRTVAKRYSEIYEKLGVGGKQGLLESVGVK